MVYALNPKDLTSILLGRIALAYLTLPLPSRTLLAWIMIWPMCSLPSSLWSHISSNSSSSIPSLFVVFFFYTPDPQALRTLIWGCWNLTVSFLGQIWFNDLGYLSLNLPRRDEALHSIWPMAKTCRTDHEKLSLPKKADQTVWHGCENHVNVMVWSTFHVVTEAFCFKKIKWPSHTHPVGYLSLNLPRRDEALHSIWPMAKTCRTDHEKLSLPKKADQTVWHRHHTSQFVWSKACGELAANVMVHGYRVAVAIESCLAQSNWNICPQNQNGITRSDGS